MRRKVRKIIDSQPFFCIFFCIFWSEVARFWVGGGALSGEHFSFFDMHIFAFRIALFRQKPKSRGQKTNAWPSPTTHFSTKFVARKIRHAHKNLARKTPSLLRPQKNSFAPFARKKRLRPLCSQKNSFALFARKKLLRPLRSPTRRMGCSPREISQDRPDAPTHG